MTRYMTKGDFYAIRNKRKKTFKKIGDMILEIKKKEKFEEKVWTLYLQKLSSIYNIERRTIWHYLSDFIFRQGKRKVLILDDKEILIMDKAEQAVKLYNSLEDKHKKLVKYIIYSYIVWTTQS